MFPRAMFVLLLAASLSAGAVANKRTQTRKPPAPPSLPATRASTDSRPAPQAIAFPADQLSDEQIEQAIRRAADYLIKRFDRKTMQVRMSRELASQAYGCGVDALYIYALMQAGLALNEPELGPQGDLMQGMIEGLKALRADRGGPQTYARALRAMALSVFYRNEDRQALRDEVECLIVGQADGAYTYASAVPNRNRRAAPTFKGLATSDNSNSQYGFLGVWSGAEAGVEVSSDYWEEAEGHWRMTQLNNGQWGYDFRPVGGRVTIHESGGPPSLAMTAAGVATLFVARDFVNFGAEARKVGKPALSPSLERAMGWWGRGYNALDLKGAQMRGYTLFGVERVGLASGLKYFGVHDWYRALALEIVRSQRHDGGWAVERDDPPAVPDAGGVLDLETPYVLLFLARARHPVLMNKLGFDGHWSNRPRDLAALARFASKRLERPLNWQIVPVGRNWIDWTDAPIVYLASHDAPRLTEKDYDNLRAFALAGGLIFTHTDEDAPGSGERFDAWVEKTLARELFPQYELADLPAEHPIHNFPAKVIRRTPLRGMSNGWRLLLVHSPKDLAYRWQTRDEKGQEDAFQTGLNLFVYAAGTRDFRRRLEPTYVPPPSAKPSLVMAVARVKYAGAWDPEPYAWERYSRWLEWKTGYALNVQQVEWRDLRADTAPFAHLTGSVRYDPAPDELDALKRYVQEGGVLLIDDCGGRGDFAKSMRKALDDLWPHTSLRPMDATARALTAGAPGMSDVTKPKLRPSVIDKVDGATAALKWLPMPMGRGCVVLCDVDVTCGLLGANTLGLKGYEPTYAQSLLQNLLLWTLDGQPVNLAPASRPADASP